MASKTSAAPRLRRPGRCELRAQALRQQNGYAATLLWAEPEDCDEDRTDPNAEREWLASPKKSLGICEDHTLRDRP